MSKLLGQKYVGIDSEWRAQMMHFHQINGVALLQLGGYNDGFLVDMISLRDNEELDQMLTSIFTHKDTTILGFGFSSDIAMLKKNFPNMKFYMSFP
jgi:predicted acyl esterase